MFLLACVLQLDLFVKGFCFIEGAAKAAECQGMIDQLDMLQDEHLNHAAMGECIDVGDKAQMTTWLQIAHKLCDLSINATSLAKGNKTKFQNYLSS